MSQEDNIFEEALKTKLDGHHSKLKNDVWESIMSEIGDDKFKLPVVEPRNPDKGRKWLPGLLLLLLAGGLAAGFWTYSGSSTSNGNGNGNGNGNLDSNVKVDGAGNEPVKSFGTLEGESDVNGNFNVEPTVVEKSEDVTSLTAAESASINEVNKVKNVEVQRAKTLAKTAIPESSIQPVVSEEEITNTYIAGTGDIDRSVYSAQINSPTNTSRGISPPDVTNDATNSHTAPQAGITTFTNSDENEADAVSSEAGATAPNTVGNKLTQAKQSNRDNVPSSDNSMPPVGEEQETVNAEPLAAYVATEEEAKDSTQSAGVPNMESEETARKKFSIDLLAGPSYNYRFLRVSDDQILENHKNDNETSLITYSYSASVSYALSSKFRINTGLTYLRMGEKYDYSSAHASHSALNRYDYVTVPLGVEYVLERPTRVNYLAGVGAQVSFLRSGESSWVNPHSFQAQAHDHTGSDSPFANQTLGLNAKIGLNYQLTKNMHFSLQEQAYLFTNSIYKSETGLNQRSYAFQTYLGLGYRF